MMYTTASKMNLSAIKEKVTKEYKSKLFGKFLQCIDKYTFFNNKRYLIFLHDNYSLLFFLSLLEARRYIYKDVSFVVYNFTKEDISPLLERDDIFTDERKSYSLKIREKIKKENSELFEVINDTFDDEIIYIIYNMLFLGKMEALLPYDEKRKEILPFILNRDRDINYIVKKEMSSLFKDDNLLYYRIKKRDSSFIKELISQLKKENNQVEMNIFNSLFQVIPDKVLSYEKNGEKISFLDLY